VVPELEQAFRRTISDAERAITETKVLAVGQEQIEHGGCAKKLSAGWGGGDSLNEMEHRC